MTDLLIRDVPDDVVAAIDASASRLGLSRTDYLRRQLARVAADTGAPVAVEDLRRFAEDFADLGKADVMDRAWHRPVG